MNSGVIGIRYVSLAVRCLFDLLADDDNDAHSRGYGCEHDDKTL